MVLVSGLGAGGWGLGVRDSGLGVGGWGSGFGAGGFGFGEWMPKRSVPSPEPPVPWPRPEPRIPTPQSRAPSQVLPRPRISVDPQWAIGMVDVPCRVNVGLPKMNVMMGWYGALTATQTRCSNWLSPSIQSA